MIIILVQLISIVYIAMFYINIVVLKEELWSFENYCI
jgi:hypothetical protein